MIWSCVQYEVPNILNDNKNQFILFIYSICSLLYSKRCFRETAEELKSTSGGNDESESNVGDDFNMEDYDREDGEWFNVW